MILRKSPNLGLSIDVGSLSTGSLRSGPTGMLLTEASISSSEKNEVVKLDDTQKSLQVVTSCFFDYIQTHDFSGKLLGETKTPWRVTA